MFILIKNLIPKELYVIIEYHTELLHKDPLRNSQVDHINCHHQHIFMINDNLFKSPGKHQISLLDTTVST